MANFVRDILTTLAYEPDGSNALQAEGEELSRLDQRLAGFTQAGRKVALSIRPGDCSVWDGNPRDVPGLSYDGCRSLIDSIAQEDGNRIPVLVRRNPPGAELPYELLVGSRRRFAVDWLNHNGRPEIRLNALIVEMSDEEAFRLADIENREREDITEIDRARSYQAAVDRFYGGVQSRMAEALSLSNSQLSRLLSLAQMPEEVVNAFAAKGELRVRHSEVLTPLLRRADQRERILTQARILGEEQQHLAASGQRMISAAAVLARLRAVTKEVRADAMSERALLYAGEQVGRIKPGASSVTLELQVSTMADLDRIFDVARAALCEVLGQTPSTCATDESELGISRE